MVLYESRLNGRDYNLGTSGFLYRSNKLMYDKATSSLWSTLQGEPVIGPLVGKGIRLKRRSVVTTTWGEWKRRHPQTLVLSLDTGVRRDYGEGVAYQSYFATDELMFRTPFNDKRLPNKREVVALRDRDGTDPLAIDTRFLSRHPVYMFKQGGQQLVALTNSVGETRVYRSKGFTFATWNGGNQVMDTKGQAWEVDESGLRRKGEILTRYPSHQSFWFGWRAQFPKTRLIK